MSNIATAISQSRKLIELGLDPNTADCNWNTTFGEWALCVGKNNLPHAVPAWSLEALLEVMPRPDLYREIADLWVCVTFFKEGSIRGFGKTAIDAVCDTIEKMFGRGYLIKKGGQNE